MAFYIHFENSITTKFSYEKMGQSGTLTIFLKMGPLGAPKTFFSFMILHQQQNAIIRSIFYFKGSFS